MMRFRCLFTSAVLLSLSTPSMASVDFPPMPTFQKRVNYVEWYQKVSRVPEKDNAYALYAEFIPGMTGGDATESDWPRFAGMVSTTPKSEDGATNAHVWRTAPAPWYPDRRAAWEKSFKAAKSVLKKFAAAAKKKYCVPPAGIDGGKDDNENRLARISVQHVSKLRECAMGELDAAWRVGEEGSVPAKQFKRCIETNLKMAGQFRDSLFAVEQMSAFAVRSLTYQHLRWGFAHGVLSPLDAAGVIKILKRVDGKPLDASPTIRMDCAIWLDNVQYIYGPLGGGTKLNGNRYRDVTGQAMAGNRFGLAARLEADPMESARAIMEAHVEMGRQMGPGYSPAASHAINEAGGKLAGKNNLTKGMLYGLGSTYAGLYGQTARCETERRGTRLVAELFAYRAKNKKWPRKLSNLDKKSIGKDLIDPFSGKQFRYLLADDVPVLYSVGADGQDDGAAHSSEWEPSTDYVFWPIPESKPTIMAAELNALPESKFTPLARIDEKKKDKKVVVMGKVAFTVTQPSKEHGHYYNLTLKDGKREIPVFWYEDAVMIDENELAKFDQQKIRARGVVTELDGRWGVQLMKALDLAIEE